MAEAAQSTRALHDPPLRAQLLQRPREETDWEKRGSTPVAEEIAVRPSRAPLSFVEFSVWDFRSWSTEHRKSLIIRCYFPENFADDLSGSTDGPLTVCPWTVRQIAEVM